MFGWMGFLRVALQPVTAIIATPIRLGQALWACRVLADGQWDHYNRFTARHGLNSLFYWTEAMSLARYGRRGKSPCLGVGDYPLSRWFFNTLPSLFAYWRMAPIVPLVGLFGWWQAHAIWVGPMEGWWVVLVLALAVISTSFYANTFFLQNYNALGWVFFPLGLYGLESGNWLLAAFAWFSASFCSLTVVFIAGCLSAMLALQSMSLWPLMAILPATLKLLTHFGPAVSQNEGKASALKVMASIGTFTRGAKYTRKRRKIGVRQVYFFLLYAQFAVVVYYLTGNLPYLLAFGVLMFAINTTVARFADVQSIDMMMMSIVTVVTLQSYELWLLPSYWIVMSPLPLFLALPSASPALDVVPKCAPFCLKRLMEGMEEFLGPVRDGDRVLMAMADPKGVYEDVFDGYRALLELPIYVAARRGIHFLPNWFAVFELNYEGARDFWGRDAESVQANMEEWNAGFAVIYQEAGTQLSAQWTNENWETLGRFSWADYAEELRGERVYSGPTPEWWLLRRTSESVDAQAVARVKADGVTVPV